MSCGNCIPYDFPPMLPDQFVSGRTVYGDSAIKGILEAGENALIGLFPKTLTFTLNGEDMLDFSHLDVLELIKDNKGPIAFFAFFGALGILMTIIGIFWCVQRCCCRTKGCLCCGGRHSDDDYDDEYQTKSESTFTKIILGIFVASLVITSTFWTVCLFLSNELIEDNINQMPKELDNSLSDIQQFMSITSNQMEYLLVSNYQRLSDHLLNQPDIPPGADELLKNAGLSLSNSAAALTEALNTVRSDIEEARVDLGDFDDVLNDYSGIWHAAMILLGIALLFMTLMLTMGIFLGLFGRSDYEDSNAFFAKKTGVPFINCGIFLVFCTFFFCTVVMLLHFVIAGIGGRIVCKAILNVEDVHIELNRIGIKTGRADEYQVPSYNWIIQQSGNNESAYNTFGLKNVQEFDIQRLQNFSNMVTSPNGIRRVDPPSWSDDTIKELDHYGHFTYDSILNNVGNSDPLYKAYKATLDSVCIELVNPTGGFWLSSLIVLCFFIPLCIIGCYISSRVSSREQPTGIMRLFFCF